MEFGIRELIQFVTLLASLAGAFAVVKSQVSRIIQDLVQLQNYVSTVSYTHLTLPTKRIV